MPESSGCPGDSWADISPCGAYRWRLQRRWDPGRPALLFIGLNPSRADGRRDDPTLRRLLGFARRWGHGSLTVVNLFARISPSPAALHRCADPIGPANHDWLRQTLGEALAAPASSRLWLGWGNGGRWRNRDQQVLELLSAGGGGRLWALGRTASGQPRHPLYAPGSARLAPWLLAQGGKAAAS
ncbi:DUF1643 domain-containing protein [Cyanobium sp. Morenito 9A2]|uniref:DUF1643 domain-containing protein n=1 Tax=Cyanobium sp. Morenito 9A2 TaxID=2823718 RepID=UPI0020CDF04A|nr:DUF1643 domain-containing protein [Cyanobium sp. Morenito 9A2]